MTAQDFPQLSRRFTQAMVNAYGEVNEDRNLIHYDLAAAKQAGFPAPLVHGAIAAALVSEACRTHFGPAWLAAGRLKVSFIKPLFVGQTATTGGRPLPGLGAPRYEVWCRNESGEDVVVGEAECPPP